MKYSLKSVKQKSYNLLKTNLFIVLIMSLTFFNTLTIAQVAPPYKNTLTGDFDNYNIIGKEDEINDIKFNLWNFTNPLDITISQDQNNWEIKNYKGWSNFHFIRDANETDDTWAIINRETINVHPSQKGGIDYLFDKNDPNSPYNNTLPNEDTTGHIKNDEEKSQIKSNSTYSRLFDDILEKQLKIDLLGNLLNDDTQPTAPNIVPMDWLSISIEDQEWVINDEMFSISTRIITALFSLNWEANSLITYSPGNTDPVSFDVNQTFIYSSLRSYYYDDINGIFLGSNVITSVNYKAFLWKDYFQITSQGIAEPGFSASNRTIYFGKNVTESALINQTSNGYGNFRPESIGSNILETGDSLIYKLETSNQFDSFFDRSFSDSFGTRSRREVIKFRADGFGNLEKRIWRHEPRLVEGVNIIVGESTIIENRNITEPNPDFPGEFYTNSFVELFFDFDFFETPSSNDHELELELNSMELIDFSHNNNCLGCDDYGIDIPVPLEMPLFSQFSETFISPEISGNQLIINGFKYIIEIELLRGEYKSEWSGLVDIWIENGPDKVFARAPATMSALTTQVFYWDVNTGVLLAIEEESIIDIEISVGLMNYGYFIRIDLSSSTTIENRLFMLLKTHPNQYLIKQNEFPGTREPSTSDIVTSSTPDALTSNSSNFPLPLPILSVIFGLGIIIHYIRKRK